MADKQRLRVIDKVQEAVEAVEAELGAAPNGPDAPTLQATRVKLQDLADDLVDEELSESVETLTQHANELGTVLIQIRAREGALRKVAEVVADVAQGLSVLVSIAKAVKGLGPLG